MLSSRESNVMQQIGQFVFTQMGNTTLSGASGMMASAYSGMRRSSPGNGIYIYIYIYYIFSKLY